MKFYTKKVFFIYCILPLLASCDTHQKQSANHQKTTEYSLAASVKLGNYLFYDNRLSFNKTKSCSSCHDPSLAFTDGYRTSTTATGDNVKRNAPSLVNVMYQKRFDWANPTVNNTFEQNERPLFNESPVELGVKNNEEKILQYFRETQLYKKLFADAFPRDTVITVTHIRRSLSDFVNSIESFNSSYDAFIKGDSIKLSASAKRGLSLFSSTKLKCVSCHMPPLFTLNDNRNNISPDSIYFNTGLYGLDTLGTDSSSDQGLFLFTHQPKDRGKFKVPSLRNVALTAPYQHDGTVASLSEVIDIYRDGGRVTKKSDGRFNPNKDSRIQGFSLSVQEKKDLLEFLYSLTDSTLAKNPSFANPHKYH